ncbi:MAG: hypothetical protein ACM3Q4_13870 [Acidobacteriota bacterium]
MSFTSHIHWFVLLALAALAAALSFWSYRTTIPPVSTAKKTVLALLRASTLVLLLILIAEPLLRLRRTEEERPRIALVADNSLSMTLADKKGNREAILRAIFADPEWDRLSSDADIERYRIDPSLSHAAPDSLVMNGASTDLSSALASLLSRHEERPSAIVLVSDGAYNTGANPLSEAERSAIPIYTVGIGDSSEQKDVAVMKASGNAIAYVESSVPVDAVVKSTGYAGGQVRVRLFEEGRQIDERLLSLASSQEEASEYPLRLTYMPKTEGMKKLTVRVDPLPGEATEKNNARSFMVKVLSNKLRTVVIAGAPGADAAAVMQTLEEDRNGEPVIFYQTPDGRLRGEKTSQSLTAAASAADCIVLVGFPTSQTTAQNLQTVLQAVEAKQVPVLFIAGRMIDLAKLSVLTPVLPFTVAPGSRIDEQPVVASIPPSQQSNELVTAQRSAAIWEKLPPIYSTLGVFKAKPEATVLATMKMQGVPLSVPLIVSSSVGRRKSAAILGYGIARWKLLAGASAETERFFTSWFSTASRWLSVREEDRRLRVEPDRELFSQGEAVSFSGQAYTETLDPLENADIRIEAVEQRSKAKTETMMHSTGAGRYEGSLAGLPEGEYAYSASAQLNGQAIGTVHGRFTVGEQSLEFTDTKLNATLMRQIAALSGGAYAGQEEYRSLFERLKASPVLRPKETVTEKELDMWNAPALFSVIILCAGAEWFIRKRSGMV